MFDIKDFAAADFDLFGNDFSKQKEAEKKPEKKPAKEEKAKKPKKVSSKKKVPDGIINGMFQNSVRLVTAFGSLLIQKELPISSQEIRKEILAGETLHEAAADNVFYIKIAADGDTDIVVAAVNRTKVDTLEAGKLTCGEYVMHFEGGSVNELKKNWQSFMQGNIGCYKVQEGEYGLWINGGESKKISSVVGYEDIDAETTDELFKKLFTTNTLPGTVSAKVIGIEEDAEEDADEKKTYVLQIYYTGPGEENGIGSASPLTAATRTAKTQAEKDKEYMQTKVSLPVVVKLPWPSTQEFTSDDFDGENEITLEELHEKLISLWSIIRDLEKKRSTFLYYGKVLVDGYTEPKEYVECSRPVQSSKGAACPF